MKNAKKAKLDNSIFLIQKINLQWDKDCRGGAGAALRNHYPKAAQLPENYFSYYPFGVPAHYIRFIQKTDGIHTQRESRNLEKWRNDGTLRLEPFELSVKDGITKVSYRFDLHYGAHPERQKYNPAISRYVPLHEPAFFFRILLSR